MVLPGDAGGRKKDKIEAALTESHRTVVGVFDTVDAAQVALDALDQVGIPRDAISLVSRGSDAAEEIPSQAASEEASGGAATGAVLGGVGGGVLAGLVGAGLLAIPGAGPLLAAGWLVSALGGAAVGASAGGLIGAMVRLGVPEDLAKHYQDLAKQGHYLVMVLAQEGDEEAEVERLLQKHGANDVARYHYQVRPDQFPGSETPPDSPAP